MMVTPGRTPSSGRHRLGGAASDAWCITPGRVPSSGCLRQAAAWVARIKAGTVIDQWRGGNASGIA